MGVRVHVFFNLGHTWSKVSCFDFSSSAKIARVLRQVVGSAPEPVGSGYRSEEQILPPI